MSPIFELGGRSGKEFRAGSGLLVITECDEDMGRRVARVQRAHLSRR
jgi:hypothetical protein